MTRVLGILMMGVACALSACHHKGGATGSVLVDALVQLDGVPAALNNATTVTIHVSGPDLQHYRYKFGPSASTICADDAGYGDAALPSTPVTIDQTQLADGDYRLCVIGQNSSGTWQPLTSATVAAWTLDRHGPGAFTINPITSPTQPTDAIDVTWTTPTPQAAQSYQVVLAGPGGCGTPVQTIHTTTQSAPLGTSLPGGHYSVCVTAFDDLDNATPATNNGAVTFDSPPQLVLAFFKGTGADTKSLQVGTRTGLTGQFHVAAVPVPNSGARFANRGALQLDATGRALVAYQAIEQPDQSPSRLALGLATAGDGDSFASQELAAAVHPGTAGVQASLAVAATGQIHAAHLAQDQAGTAQQLVYTQVMPNGAIASSNVATAGATPFTDAALALDQSGRLHLVYAEGAALTYQLQTGGAWSAAQAIAAPGCASIDLATIAVGGTDARFIAYECSHLDGTTASCTLGLAASSGGGPWLAADVAVIDPAAECVPFNSGRPALAVDGQGRALLFWRYTDAAHVGSWDVAFAATGAGASSVAPQTLGDWGAHTGFPMLTLDATDQVYALYLAGDQVKLASGQGNAALSSTVVAFDGDGGTSGTALELVDVLVRGGHGRGVQADAH